jgi:hypothetical protein
MKYEFAIYNLQSASKQISPLDVGIFSGRAAPFAYDDGGSPRSELPAARRHNGGEDHDQAAVG